MSSQVVSRLHVVASDLRWPGATQLGLFEPPAERAEAIARLKRQTMERRTISPPPSKDPPFIRATASHSGTIHAAILVLAAVKSPPKMGAP